MMYKLYVFTGEFCPACKSFKSTYKRVVMEMENLFEFMEVNAEVNTDEVLRMKVQAIPTTILTENGIELWRKVGTIKYEDFKSMLEMYLEE